MKYVQSYTEFLNESATPGEWVTFVEYEKKGKELKGTHKSHRAAKMAMKKLERSIEGDDTVEGWGMMSKKEWDKTEAPFLKESFNIKKVLRKIGWAGEDWTPREFKSQIRKLDDKTLLDWDKSNKGLPNTPLEFQQKLIKSEIERRGLNESVDLNESTKTEAALKDLHFETDPKKFKLMVDRLRRGTGWSNDDFEYMFKRFRKSIGEEGLGAEPYPEERAAEDKSKAEAEARRKREEAELEKKRKRAAQWNKRKYDRWIKDSASNGGADNAYDMAQNAKWEPGLLDYVRRNLVYTETPLQRIQWDIEMYS